MDRVFLQAEKPIGDVRFVGVAIRAISSNQRHLGILHKEANSESPLLLHLGWHHSLRNEDPKPSYIWIDPDISTRRLRQVAAFSRKVWRSNGHTFPYALSSPNDCFDLASGQYLIGPTNVGLTCSTFVVAIFHATGISLINAASWPANRTGDAEWRQFVIETLKVNPPAPPEHIRAIESDSGWVRYRPEDVAAAATTKPPADYSSIEVLGQQIVQLLEQPSVRPARVRQSFLRALWGNGARLFQTIRSLFDRG